MKLQRVVLAALIVTAMSIWMTGCSSASNSDSPSNASSEVGSTSSSSSNVDATAEEPVKSSGEFSMVGIEATPLTQGYYEVSFTLRNDSDETLDLAGFDVLELDADGNILDSYKSYNKNAVDIPVEPGQEASIPLTFSEDDNISGFKSTKYYTKSDSGKEEGTFNEPFQAEVAIPR